jgi:hypothetical protein
MRSIAGAVPADANRAKTARTAAVINALLFMGPPLVRWLINTPELYSKELIIKIIQHVKKFLTELYKK